MGTHVSYEPTLTPSIKSSISALLKETILESCSRQEGRGRRSVLISSNSLASRIVYLRWGIRPSQRRQYRNLFSEVREQCRELFRYYVNQGEVVSQKEGTEYRYGVYKFDEVRGNLILGIVYVDADSPFLPKPSN
ncbi:MAG: hypothetical protein C4K48_01685 [Candidatus Thorarchaeota archaeon]|nr:MAG: hypothetical protein C4K48_01685 [Candidatus Thorarchaeota archaeon]